MEVSLVIRSQALPELHLRLNREATTDDLRKVISVLVQLSIKDLENNKSLKPPKSSSKEMIRTAYLMIFDPRYKMMFGDAYISLEEMIGIICKGNSYYTVPLFREAMKEKLCIKKQKNM